MTKRLFLTLCLTLGGCATVSTMPVGQKPTPLIRKAPFEGSSSQGQSESDLNLSSPAGSITAQASRLGRIVYVHARFQNTSQKPIAFGPDQITLADSGGKLLRSLGPEEVVAPFQERAAFLQNKAQQAALAGHQARRDQRINDRNLERSGAYESDNKTARDLAATSDLLMLLGSLSQDSAAMQLQSQAEASQAESAAIAQRIQSSLLQSRVVPPGTISEGWVYFAEPQAWPATLRAQVNEQILSESLIQRP